MSSFQKATLMPLPNLGLLHPGAMGISLAAAAQQSGHTVYWASQGRSAETRERAEKFALVDAGTLAELCSTCAVIVSVCPPEAAEAVAGAVLASGFTGLYVEANAIAPRRAVALSQALEAAGAGFVDGSLIGGPAWTPGATTLYLAGRRAAQAAACFAAGPLATRIIGDEPGKASALKMCYAAYTKGTTALLGAILAAAEQLGVRPELDQQWAEDDPDFARDTAQRVRRSALKAWRFAGEMDEIAATFRAAGLPGEFHEAAGVLYRRLAGFRGAAPALEAVLAALRQAEANEGEV